MRRGGWRSNPASASIPSGDRTDTAPTSRSSRSANDRISPVTSRHARLAGRKPGDRRVRVERPHSAYFRYTGERTLVAKQAASVPRTPTGRALARVRAGPLRAAASNEEEVEQRLNVGDRAAGPRIGQHLVVGLRDRRDHARARCSPAPARSC